MFSIFRLNKKFKDQFFKKINDQNKSYKGDLRSMKKYFSEGLKDPGRTQKM